MTKKKKVEMLYTSLREQDAHNIRAGIHTGGGNAANNTGWLRNIKVLNKKARVVFTVAECWL